MHPEIIFNTGFYKKQYQIFTQNNMTKINIQEKECAPRTSRGVIAQKQNIPIDETSRWTRARTASSFCDSKFCQIFGIILVVQRMQSTDKQTEMNLSIFNVFNQIYERTFAQSNP